MTCLNYIMNGKRETDMRLWFLSLYYSSCFHIIWKKKFSLANLYMRYDNIENRFPFYAYIVYCWINVRYIRDILVELFFYHYRILFLARMHTSIHVLRVYRGSRVRGFIPSVLDWSCHTRVILLRNGCSTDRAHIVFGCPLFGSFLPSTSTVSAHLNTNPCFVKRREWKKTYVRLI